MSQNDQWKIFFVLLFAGSILAFLAYGHFVIEPKLDAIINTY